MKKKYISIILIIALSLSVLTMAVSCAKAEDVTAYEIWLDFNDDGVDCAQKLHFVNTSQSVLDNLKLNVYANAFDSKKPLPCTPQEQAEAYPNGVSFGKFELEQLHGDLADYQFDFDKNLITVDLAQPLQPGESVDLQFVYSLVLPNTLLRYGFNERGVTLTGFYPQLCALVDGEWYYDDFSAIGDPYFADVANYEVNFNLPNGYEYVSSGKSKSSEEDGEILITAKAENIRDFALVISPELNKKTENYKGVELNYLGKNPYTLEYAKKALDAYSAMFGKYAYDTLSIADMPFAAGGMEYGSLCVINEDIKDVAYEEVVAHEIAHQWWYSAVGSNNLINAWQDEGLTNYSTYLYFVEYCNLDYADLMITDAYTQYRRFCDIQNSVGEPAVGKLGGRLTEFPSNYYYTNLTYNKSLMVWKHAQDTLGKDNLIKALKIYAERYKFAIASEDDLWNTLDETIPDASKLLKDFIKAI
ncbi:MAG: M1 family metallopeptidase [Clostridia bacterium]|nr:M1 family metallopeptidase [Clostridia bacterium]